MLEPPQIVTDSCRVGVRRQAHDRDQRCAEARAEALEIAITNPIAVASVARPSGGRGVVGMRERAGLLGGTLAAEERGGRFELTATLPYDRHEDAG